jgi:hypothetical protein
MDQSAVDDSSRGKDGERERQIETRTALGDVGGQQCQRDTPLWPVDSGVEDRRTNAIARLDYRCVGTPRERQAGQTRGDVCFDLDQLTVHPVQCDGKRACDRHQKAPRRCSTAAAPCR